MTYGELYTLIQNYCQVSETTFNSSIPDFVRAAENAVYSVVDLPSRWEDDDDVTLVAGQAEYVIGASASADDGAMDILSVRVSEGTAAQSAGVEYGPVRYLLLKDYDFMLEAYAGSTTASEKGIPKYYSISQAGKSSDNNPNLSIRLGPIPDAAYPATVTYSKKTAENSITATSGSGSSSTTRTWLSVSYPEVLLYGSLVHAYIFLKGEPDLIQNCEKQFLEGMALIKNVVESRAENDDYRPGTSRGTN
jgi:hypothetical protein|tara:strand:- start:13260 stop:14006 length:747 start_codon:yes stop_codon:yes gene_type:complete